MKLPTILPALLVALLLVACARVPGPEDGHLIRGRLLDAETGEPVSRERFYIHLFCDGVDFQLSLDPAAGEEYAGRVPERAVRVRVATSSGLYHLYEKRITLEGDETEHDVRLKPTHNVRLFGKVTDLNTGKPVVWTGDGTIGSAPILGFYTDTGPHGGNVETGDNGTYSVYVPRTKLTVTLLDTPLGPTVKTLDLTGITGDEHRVDIDTK